MDETRPIPGPTLTETEPAPTMTDAPTAAPPQPPARPPLRRSRTNRVMGGVCGGLGAYFDIDPVLIRVLFVVLTVFSGGLFVFVWLVLLLAVPEEPPAGPAPGAASYDPQQPFSAGGTGQYVGPGGVAYGPPPPPIPRPPRSYLGLITVSAALVVGGALALAASLGADVPGAVVLAAMLGVLGVGLVVGAYRGRARWLVALAIPLLLLTLLVGTVSKAGPLTPVGDRTWVPTATSTATGYELGTGTAILDLRALSGTGETRSLTAHVGLGQLRVLVPTDVRLVIHAEVGIGRIDLPGLRPGGGAGNSTTATVEPLGSPAVVTIVELDAHVGVGNLEVRRAAS